MADVSLDPTLEQVPRVSIDHVRARLHDRRVTVLDVLPRETYAAGHIPGATNIPLAELESRAPRELPDRTREIVTYCGGPT